MKVINLSPTTAGLSVIAHPSRLHLPDPLSLSTALRL